jgi:hypothetical protein
LLKKQPAERKNQPYLKETDCILTHLLSAYFQVTISHSVGEISFLQLVVDLVKTCSSFDNTKSKVLIDVLLYSKNL